MAPPWLPGTGIDFIASLAIVVSCFVIFFRTREFYALSKHEGIRYFRYAFLFFGISFIGELLRPIMFYLHTEPTFRHAPYGFFLSLFAGTIAIFTLLYSVLWKRLDKHVRYPMSWIVLIGAIITIAALIERARLLMLLLHTAVFVTVIIISYLEAARAKKKRVTHLYLLYLLLFASWVANTAANIIARSSFVAAGALNLISAILFAILAYRVVARTAVGRR